MAEQNKENTSTKKTVTSKQKIFDKQLVNSMKKHSKACGDEKKIDYKLVLAECQPSIHTCYHISR